MESRNLFHCNSWNAKKSDSETKNESQIIERLAEQIAAITLEEKSNQPPPPSPPPLVPEVFTVKQQLAKMVENFHDRLLLPDIVAEIILENNLNIMIIDLYDFDKGFSVSFLKFGEEEEMFHGEYSYGVGLLDYIKDGEIPYEVLDNLHKYEFNILYDGYIMCQLRSHFDEEDNIKSHFVFLRQSLQTVDGECAMKCKADSSLDYDEERAKLIRKYSPEICLDLDAASSPNFGLNNWRQQPFMTPYLKHLIMDEKTKYERGVKKMLKKKKRQRRRDMYDEFEEELLEILKHRSVASEEDWDFRHSKPEDATTAEFDGSAELDASAELNGLAELDASFKATEFKSPVRSYLKVRKMCFPGREHFTSGRFGSHVEIENFMYEYTRKTKAGNTESIQGKLRISVVDPREYYYGAYQDNKGMELVWDSIGRREELDAYIVTATEKYMNLRCGEMIITHNRFFDEQVEVSNGRVKIVFKELEVPLSEVVLRVPPPSHRPGEE